jgi:predicted lipid-binding transport protein (Tim44 family)
MKKFLLSLMLAVSALSMVVADADAARRMGGGGSIGRQSSNVTRQAPAGNAAPMQNQAANPAQARPGAAATPAPRPASPWRNILGGALLGLGLGALLSHFGLGGALAGMISTILTIALLALAAMFIYRMFRRKNEPAARPSYAGAYSSGNTPEIGSRIEPQVESNARPAALQADSQAAAFGGAGGTVAAAQPWGVPADLDVPAFLRSAKTYFIRLQAAWDKGDVEDIREFSTPEMFAELRVQMQERGALPSQTDVVSLDAELLGIETVANEYLSSVKFSGMIKEDMNAPAEPFTEVWNLVKPVSGQGGWVLAGIQQLSQA